MAVCCVDYDHSPLDHIRNGVAFPVWSLHLCNSPLLKYNIEKNKWTKQKHSFKDWPIKKRKYTQVCSHVEHNQLGYPLPINEEAKRLNWKISFQVR